MSLVNLQRRTFLAQAGAGAAALTAGTLLGTASAAATQCRAWECCACAGWPPGRRGDSWPGNAVEVSISCSSRRVDSPSRAPTAHFPGWIFRQRADRSGHQYLVCLRLPRRHLVGCSTCGTGMGQGHQPHDRRRGKASSGTGAGDRRARSRGLGSWPALEFAICHEPEQERTFLRQAASMLQDVTGRRSGATTATGCVAAPTPCCCCKSLATSITSTM